MSHFRNQTSNTAVAKGASIPAHPYRAGVLAFAFSFWFSSTTVALNPTPTSTPDVPPAELCTVPAHSFEELNAMVNMLISGASPVPARTPGIVPNGTPVDPATETAIVATIRELVGCFNAGEPLRSYGLYTAPYLNRLFNRQGGFSRSAYDSLATPEPAADPSTHTAILAITDIRLFDDNRAGANVTFRYASIPMPKHFYFSFEWNGERWLISGILGEISFSVP